MDSTNAFAAIAETLLTESAAGLLIAVCDRWIYKTCLCFPLDVEERRRSRFRYEYSTYQLEYSRNLLFRQGAEMVQVAEALIDRNRSRMDVERLKNILGRKTRPHRRNKKTKEVASIASSGRETHMRFVDLQGVLRKSGTEDLHQGRTRLANRSNGDRYQNFKVWARHWKFCNSSKYFETDAGALLERAYVYRSLLYWTGHSGTTLCTVEGGSVSSSWH